MGQKSNELDAPRGTAEAQLVSAKQPGKRSNLDLLHELQVHQAELEMQNENLRQAQVALEESRDRYVEFYDFAPVGYLTLNRDACITEINLTGAALLGDDRAKFMNRRFATLIAPEDRDYWHMYFMSVLQQDSRQTCELSMLCRDGAHLEVQLDALRHVEKNATQTIRIVMTDITERKQVEKRIGYLATHDRMTDLPNRELFYDRLSQAISQAKRKEERFAVLFMDLDGFKAVNDNFGHEAGDAVLKIAAARFQTCIRDMDTVARIGGDEFAIILNNVKQLEDASNVARKIIAAISDPIKPDETTECRIGVSIGIALYPQNGPEIDKLMHAADSAMYQSKTGGKNNFSFFDELSGGQESNEPWINFDATKFVGVRVMDQQHETLAEMINKLNTAFNGNENIEVVSGILDEISVYTRFHFDTEERLMERFSYPEILEHKKEHQNLLAEFAFLKKKFLEGGESVVLHTLKNWLFLHITNSDKPLAAFLNKLHDVD
ncbi:MAG: bacteriohemerythrin [Gammaproteobacteria bacterium]|nr:bacteriohemerythrin [Gammaproteobacteria bacterium]MBU1480180.1 bacteriohemerythrin [Gammaproteobacteria bacterium]